MPAMGVDAKSFADPLTKLDSENWWIADGWANGFPFLNRWSAESISFSEHGLAISLGPDGHQISNNERFQQGDAIDLVGGEYRTHGFYGYGCYEIEMKPVRAPGVVTSFFLFAGPYDKPKNGNGIHNEIDIEFLGSNTNMVQLNFWTDDDAYANSHETLVFLDFDASQAFHHYAIDWGPKAIEWFIDGRSVMKFDDSPYDPIPKVSSSRLRVMANVWATHPNISNWAGLYDQRNLQQHVAEYRNFRFTARKRCHF
ncbi:family 16 glycosylhydrolase [Vibrio sp. SM6]|uniref:Beta-glucanase n=2 Tax=Vibrio agarilyticus TaxID=2726741 RepID=A0A7X8TNH9_9VIBR|nr:family 16 glycosylhydrolase [Vibrio agarilyticus]